MHICKKTKDIKISLAGCDELENGPDPQLWNCYRGVFSEYASLALGYDSDTGLPLPNGPVFELNKSDPYKVCQDLLVKYKESCLTQLTRVFLSDTRDELTALSKCLDKRYDLDTQKTCINILSGVKSRSNLSKSDKITIPNMVFDLSPTLKQAYIDGFKETLVGYKMSRIPKDWRPFCEQFTQATDKTLCEESFRNF